MIDPLRNITVSLPGDTDSIPDHQYHTQNPCETCGALTEGPVILFLTADHSNVRFCLSCWRAATKRVEDILESVLGD